MKYLIAFIKEYKGKAALSLLLLLGQVVGTLLIPFLVAGVVDQGILKGDMAAITRIGVLMLAVSVLATGIAVLGSYATADLGALFGRDMRRKLFARTQELSVKQFEEIGVSSMITRATSDIANLQQTMGLVLQLVVPAPIIMAAAVVMTASVSPFMALLLIFFMALFLIFAAIMLKKSNALSRSIQVRLDRINKVVRESITGVRVIRAFGNEQYEERRSGKAFESYAGNMIKLNKLFAVLNPAVWLLMGVCMAAIVALGGSFAVGGTMEVGEITAVTEYAIITLNYLIMGATVMTTLPKARACLDRLEEVLDTEPAVSDLPAPETPGGSDCAVEFDHVTFAYPGAEEPVIRDLSFRCRAGETTAFIGSTGSGKSTVADLLLRLHDIQEGQIRISGVDVAALKQHELRERVGYVPQKAFLFSGTVAENLRMGRADAAEADLWEALPVAQADAFV
ncbi:MAG: ABC transporter ATP-binding protein, partial [Clostridia bacterium]|nr:ABC transporter ATP-binding protein [Clostridia bacterium]